MAPAEMHTINGVSARHVDSVDATVHRRRSHISALKYDLFNYYHPRNEPD